MMPDWKLCLAGENWAWFTSRKLEDQWGDDWDKEINSCNAGPPYDWQKGSDVAWYKVLQVVWVGLFKANGDPSAEQINSEREPWLTGVATIHAGASVKEFTMGVYANGGRVFTEAAQAGSALSETVECMANIRVYYRKVAKTPITLNFAG